MGYFRSSPAHAFLLHPRISVSHDTLSVIDSFLPVHILVHKNRIKAETSDSAQLLPSCSSWIKILCIFHLPSLQGDHLHVQPHVGHCHLVLSQGPCLVRADDDDDEPMKKMTASIQVYPMTMAMMKKTTPMKSAMVVIRRTKL